MTPGRKKPRPSKKSASPKKKVVRTPFKVAVSDRQTRRDATADDVKAAVRTVMRLHGVRKCDVSVGIVDDPTMHALNAQYLQHDYPTDVLSFLLDDEDGKIEGEIIVSADYAAREAERHGWSAREELLLYVVHGSLHIVGRDDLTPEGAAEMRRLEREAFAEMGLPAPPWFPAGDDPEAS